MPLAVGELKVARADVVEVGVAEDVVVAILGGDARRAPADDDRELRLVVDVLGERGNQDRGVWTYDRRRELREHQRALGRFHSALRRVVAVVQPDANHLAGARDRGEERDVTERKDRTLGAKVRQPGLGRIARDGIVRCVCLGQAGSVEVEPIEVALGRRDAQGFVREVEDLAAGEQCAEAVRRLSSPANRTRG